MSYTLRALVLASTAASSLAFSAMADDGWNLDLYGRLMQDYTIADADKTDFDVNRGQIRRARVGLKGGRGEFSFNVELDTNSSGDIEFTDAFIQYAPSGSKWSFIIGQDNTPNSLDELTSSRFSSTVERASFTDAFGLDRRLGIMAKTKGDNWTFMAGAFAANVNDTPGEEGTALAARYTLNPVNTDDLLVHLGASVRYREIGDDQGPIRYRQRPYTAIPGRIISTGSIAQSDTFVGLEGAALFGQAWIATEGVTLRTDAPAAGDPELNGGYIEAGYFFGGKRVYKGGKFDRPDVYRTVRNNGLGALAVVARYDTLDLAGGGKLDNMILGAEWYLTRKVHVSLNAFQSDASLGNTTSGLDPAFADAVRAGLQSDSVSGLNMRFQFDF